MEACQGAEPVSTSMADNCPGEAMASVPGPKVEPSEAVKAGATSSTGGASGVKPLNSGRTVSEIQNVTNDSADSSRRPTPQFIEGLERCFMHLCEVCLCLDEKTCLAAMKLFRESKRHLIANLGVMGTGNAEEAAHLWYACILFAVKSLSNKTTSDNLEEDTVAGFTLSQILKATKLRLIDFFKEIPQILAKVGPELSSMYGEDWEKRLQAKELQADFYYLTVLFNYYKRVYYNLFSDEGPRGSLSGSLGGGATSIHMRFGWMLFLALRMRVLSRFMDLVTYINGLLAVVIIMILHMPPSLRKFTFEDEAFFKERSADGRVKLVASLCARYHDASEEDVSKMVEKASSMIGDLFRKSSSFRTRSHAEQLAGIDTEGLAYFEGLMDERSVSSNLRIVEKDYEEAYHSRGELDERMFINGEENYLGTLSSGTPSTSSGSKRKYEAISSPNQAAISTGVCPSSPSSPCSSPVKASAAGPINKLPAGTPVSVTMSTVKWLRTVISPLPAKPSPELQQYFQSCDQDITNDVTYRAQVLLEGIFSNAGANKTRDSKGSVVLDSGWAEQRRQEALKLYYRVLTGMCKAESQRLGNKNLSLLLTNERFHRCMLACSAELVLYTHKTVKMTFPAVLEPTGITAFDLSKVIESFVRHEETLPRELKRHLNSMEQQILESMAWEKGSSMYSWLIVAKKNLAETINRMGLMAEPMPSLDFLGQQNRILSGNTQQLRDGAAEGSGASGSPQRVVVPSASNTHGPPVVSNGSSEVSCSFRSPVKERTSAFSAFTSPAKNRIQPTLQLAFASPQRPSPLGGGETCAETVINVFFQKVLKLAFVRIKDLCCRLQQSSEVWDQVYRAMQHILHKATHLFFKRHIDQLILCSIYGVCKVRKADVTFKKCIEQYGKQPQCKSHVFRNVYIDMPVRGDSKNGQGTGDIIKFYNEVFVPATKLYLQHLGSSAVVSAPMTNRNGDEDRNDTDGPGPGSPKVPSFVALPDMSPKKVSATHNVYVSPLRATKMDTIMSPHTRSLYACVGESTHAYQSPSKDLSAINHRLNPRRVGGRLDFTEAGCDSRLVSDSLVAGSLYPCTRNGNHHTTPAWTMAAPLPPSPLKRPRPDR
ncbi:protein MpRBR [Marchantia polymorpha subsp. ruderalis]|uniref:Retinoblastoma-related protein n=1 Tax=Marchantia polymorpha TaxID=3197 RepID=A0A2R6W850_MARPO|nr:hypothetical protein MARPO_0131s0020 [Marchantia polymorpha]PTQ30023.1 hypothetical protein MARPO_0131s0020 [Marchantia polymorpha]BBN20404.1 hypothetical protein Mp_8g18830 [Marchantia polymorpha subsp. ruderalis]BBN20405.1 hypothetical protein Mp_8g18830 [Marchantia polymorpha subsp. ruderalis]|eukprot:PTQ30022.1 hypothetical protein MARPO_0131s0020 [Marchantia polymorpha]